MAQEGEASETLQTGLPWAAAAGMSEWVGAAWEAAEALFESVVDA